MKNSSSTRPPVVKTKVRARKNQSLVSWDRLKEHFAKLINEHWKTLAGWGLSGWIALATNWANELLPLPSELFVKGVIWWIIYSIVVVSITTMHALRFLKRPVGERYLQLLLPMMGFLIGFSIAFPLLFHYVNRKWLQSDDPTEFLLTFVEPRIFGLNFACLTGFLCYLGFFVTDLYTNIKQSLLNDIPQNVVNVDIASASPSVNEVMEVDNTSQKDE